MLTVSLPRFNSTSICQILQNHLIRYPQMQLQDLYKLLHQAALGSEHAVRDPEAVRNWMTRELAAMGDGPDDPLLDPLSPDGKIVRVHLRPYVRAGGDPEVLLQAFLRTAREWRGECKKLLVWGAVAADIADASRWPLTGDAIRSFFATMESQGFLAAHHSETYRRLYHPAYRVVAKEFMEVV